MYAMAFLSKHSAKTVLSVRIDRHVISYVVELTYILIKRLVNTDEQ